MSAIQQVMLMIKKATVTITNKWTKQVAREAPLSTRYLNGTIISVGNYGFIRTSIDGHTWETKNIDTAVGIMFFDIAWTGSLYVLVGSSNTVLTSPDLINWTACASGHLSTASIFGVASNGTRIVTGASSGVIRTSDDGGTTWTARTSNVGSINKIIYAGGQFVSVGGAGTTEIATSPDGATWTKRSMGTNCYCNDIAYDGSSVYIIAGQIVGGNGAILKSSNGGVSWAVQSSGLETTITNMITNVCWAGDRFIISYNGGNSMSTDAASTYTTWTLSTSSTAMGPMCYTGSFTVGTFSFGSSTSTNGLDWISSTADPSSNGVFSGFGTAPTPNAIKCVNGKYFYMINSTVFYISDNTTTWAKARFNVTPATNFLSVSGNSSVYVAVGVSGIAFSSTDGINWTQRTSGTSNNFYDVASDGTNIVAVGATGTVKTTTDGITWTTRTVTGSGTITAITYGNGKFVAVASGNSYVSSDGGATWSTYTVASLNPQSYSLVYTGQNYICATTSTGGVVKTSSDGINWTSKAIGTSASGATIGIASNGSGTVIAFSNLSSTYNVGAYSTDHGATWTTTTSKFFSGLQVSACGYNPSVSKFLAGSAYSSMQSSSDGATWAIIPRALQTSVYGLQIINDIYYAVPGYGTYPYLFKSTDKGLTWQHSIMGGFTSPASEFIWDGSQFVVAGGAGAGAPGVFTSPDGYQWTARTVTAGSSTTPLRSIAYNGSGTYVVCNGQGNVSNGGIWTSTDNAVTWTKTNTAAMCNRVRWLGGQFIAVGYDGSSGLIYTSPDGITWTRVGLMSGVTFTDVAYSGSKWVAVATAGTARIYTSTDSATWNSLAGSSGFYITVVYYANNTFIAAGNSNSYISTDNGSNWVTLNANTNGAIYDLMWDGTKFIGCQQSRGGLYSYTPA